MTTRSAQPGGGDVLIALRKMIEAGVPGEVGPTAWATYTALAIVHRNRHGRAYPGVEKLASYVDRGDRQVREALSALERRGLIRTEHRGSPGRATTYLVALEPVAEWQSETSKHRRKATGVRRQKPASDEVNTGGKPPSHRRKTADQQLMNSPGRTAGAVLPDGGGAARASVEVMTFPCRDHADGWTLTLTKLDEWQQTYPDLDVLTECRRARQWLNDNPTKGKTRRGMTGFIGRWLARSDDDRLNGRARRRNGASDDGPRVVPGDIHETDPDDPDLLAILGGPHV